MEPDSRPKTGFENMTTKRQSTLFNYFTKTPPPNKKAHLEESPIEKTKETPKSESLHKKRERQVTPEVNKNDSDDESPVAPKGRKRIKINPIHSDDSDVENKADNCIKVKVSSEKHLDSFGYKPNQTPKNRTSISLTTNQKDSATEKSQRETGEEGDWVHCKLKFLKPEYIRDANKRRPDHPEYDPTTLHVPHEFLNTQTPAHRQWWEMKASNFDCVLFFKVGKFYELYHMDAAVGVNELGFSYMKGEFAHSGFPESAYTSMANTLVSKGYKVARVEQTETPDMMQERCRQTGKNSKNDKVVRREICQVTVKGTQVCGLQDKGPGDTAANYMMAISEEKMNGVNVFGVCFVDVSIGTFNLGQFPDDKHCSRLLTTLAHYPPTLVVFDRKTTSPQTSQMLSIHCHNARRENVTMKSPDSVLKLLADKYYKTDSDEDWPDGLKPYLHEGDVLGLTPAENCYLAIKALGGCVSYLTASLLDIQTLTMARFKQYSPPDMAISTLSKDNKVQNKWTGGNTMVLDATTLRNLRIVQDDGCLFEKLDFCSTAFGKRLLYQWVCAPSCNLNAIKERQEAVKTLFENRQICQEAKSILTSLPDLERLLTKVHTLGNLKRSKHHPDSRAIFYEEKKYSKRKVLDFISVLNGLNAVTKLMNLFSDVDGTLLNRITKFEPEGKLPDYRATLKFFKDAFNHSQAEKEGRILPEKGVEPDYDETIETISELEEELKEYLKEQEKFFRCKVAYIGSDKKRYQLEVAEKAASKAGSEYQLEGARKGYKRFSTEATKDFLARMIEAEEQKSNALKDLSRKMFERFSSKYSLWSGAIQCVATLDVLLAFAEYARQQTRDICLPKVTYDENVKPYINIKEGRHPCIPIVEDFISNDTTLGVDGGRLLLLTGPNMGGKSTLMRQVALITVLAHMGCYVPAQSCELSLVDRVFTRIGAADDILSGQSTFLVEMSETAAILSHATLNSLLLLDELGRGTSTFDGTAIATAVCAELATRGCRTLFSTHYHSLVNYLADSDHIVLGHMACMVETESAADDEIPEESITFLYKLSAGACPKSYGFNAARLAGVPADVTARARARAADLQRRV